MNRKNRRTSTLLSRISQFFFDIQAVEKADATASGTAYVVFTLADGKDVYVDADGFATMDEEQLPAGEHPLADGNILIVDEQGQFIETIETSAKAKAPEEATAPEALRRQARRRMFAEEAEADPKQAKSPQASGEEAEAGSTEALKAKIADLEARLSELANLAKEANAEVQNLRRHTPSSLPRTALSSNKRHTEMKRYEQIAQALSMSIKKGSRA